jgi:hypothetical protein
MPTVENGKEHVEKNQVRDCSCLKIVCGLFAVSRYDDFVTGSSKN